MEGNPRRVLDFWAGVEGVELEWIMASTERGREEGVRGSVEHPGRSLYIYIVHHNRIKSVYDHDGEKQWTGNHRRVSSTRHPAPKRRS